jgi:hypothetical protein
MKAKARESLRVAIEKLGRLTANDAIEGGYALLAIEQQFDYSSRKDGITTMCGSLGLCSPDQ